MKEVLLFFILAGLAFCTVGQEFQVIDRVQGTSTTEPNFIYSAFDGRQWIMGDRTIQVISADNIGWKSELFFTPTIQAQTSGSKINNLAVSEAAVWFTLESQIYATTFDNQTLEFGQPVSVSLQDINSSTVHNDAGIQGFEVFSEDNILVFAKLDTNISEQKIYIYQWLDGDIQLLSSFSPDCDSVEKIHISKTNLVVECYFSTTLYKLENGIVSEPQIIEDEIILFLDQTNNYLMYVSRNDNGLYARDLVSGMNTLVVESSPTSLKVSPYGDFIFPTFDPTKGMSSILYKLKENGTYQQNRISGESIGDPLGGPYYNVIFLNKGQVLYYGDAFYQLNDESLEYELIGRGFLTDIANGFEGSSYPLMNDSILFTQRELSTVWSGMENSGYKQQFAFTISDKIHGNQPIVAAEGVGEDWWFLGNMSLQGLESKSLIKHINSNGEEKQISVVMTDQRQAFHGQYHMKYFEDIDVLAFVTAFDYQIVLCRNPKELDADNCIIENFPKDINDFNFVKNGFVINGKGLDQSRDYSLVAHYKVNVDSINLNWEYRPEQNITIGYNQEAEYISIQLAEGTNEFISNGLTVDLEDGKLNPVLTFQKYLENRCQWKSPLLGYCTKQGILSYITIDSDSRDLLVLTKLVDENIASGYVTYIDKNDNYILVDQAKREMSVVSAEFPDLKIANFNSVIPIVNRSYFELDLKKVFSHSSLETVLFSFGYFVGENRNDLISGLGDNVYRIDFPKEYVGQNALGMLEISINDNNWRGIMRIFFDMVVINTAPEINTQATSLGIIAKGQNFELDLRTIFSDPQNDELTFSLLSAPASFTLDNNLLRGSGIPSGLFSLSVRATDPEGLTASTVVTGRIDGGQAIAPQNPQASGGGGGLAWVILMLIAMLPLRAFNCSQATPTPSLYA